MIAKRGNDVRIRNNMDGNLSNFLLDVFEWFFWGSCKIVTYGVQFICFHSILFSFALILLSLCFHMQED